MQTFWEEHVALLDALTILGKRPFAPGPPASAELRRAADRLIAALCDADRARGRVAAAGWDIGTLIVTQDLATLDRQLSDAPAGGRA